MLNKENSPKNRFAFENKLQTLSDTNEKPLFIKQDPTSWKTLIERDAFKKLNNYTNYGLVC